MHVSTTPRQLFELTAGGSTGSRGVGQLGVVPGEGVGPEVIDAALTVLESACVATKREIRIEMMPPLTARDEHGLALDEESRGVYRAWIEAGTPILHGPAGGRFVYDLRLELDLSVKITPIIPSSSLADSALVRPENLRDVDIVIVRDNSAGLYQGPFGFRSDGEAFHEARYRPDQVEQVMTAALSVAESRDGRLCVVTKPGGVPSISGLWREVAEDVCTASGSGVELSFLEIDNACFQLVANPRQFDVLVSPNMFGDVLGDTAATLLGSRGMAYSANFGPSGASVYQTAHGAAHDLAGRDVANPVAQILSLAWLVHDTLRMPEVARFMRSSVNTVLESGVRTADIAGGTSTIVGTREMSERIARHIRENAAS